MFNAYMPRLRNPDMLFDIMCEATPDNECGIRLSYLLGATAMKASQIYLNILSRYNYMPYKGSHKQECLLTLLFLLPFTFNMGNCMHVW